MAEQMFTAQHPSRRHHDAGTFVAIVLVVLAVALWQRKRAGASQQWNPHDRPAQNTRSPEEK